MSSKLYQSMGHDNRGERMSRLGLVCAWDSKVTFNGILGLSLGDYVNEAPILNWIGYNYH